MKLRIINETDRVRDRVTRAVGTVRRVRGWNGHRYALVDYDAGYSPDWLPVTDLEKLSDQR